MQMYKKVVSDRVYFTLFVALFAVLHLSYEFLTGGVRVHYPLMRDDMPAISNWWGLVLLPLLAWMFFSRMQKDVSDSELFGLSRITLYRLGGAFLYGAMLAASFELGLGQLPLYLLLCLFLLGAVYPLYRAELVLGLVMGMTYTFGAVIPTVVASIVAIASLLLHTSLRFAVRSIRALAH